jgi:hypothetical protein
MTWIRIAADLLREAMSSPAPQSPPPAEEAPAAGLDGVVGLLNRHRTEIDKNVEMVVQMLNAQNDRYLQAMRTQRRWNYGLAAGIVIVAILAIASYWR